MLEMLKFPGIHFSNWPKYSLKLPPTKVAWVWKYLVSKYFLIWPKEKQKHIILGWYRVIHIRRPLSEGEAGKAKIRCYSTYFLLKKIGSAPWPDIMLNQTLTYYWQEIFILTLTSDSEAIL